MKHGAFLFLSFLAVSSAQARPLLHLDPEMTGREYRALLDQLQTQQSFLSTRSNDPLLVILDLGKRNLDWIDAINKNRAEPDKLQLTTPELMRGYPIESPNFSNPDIIQKNFANVKTDMPKPMADILFGTGPLPETNPIDDATFLDFARKMNRVYESASRWILEEPYLGNYKEYAHSDIRGYYFLNKDTNLKWNLNHWSSLSEGTKTNYSNWLAGECFNSGATYEECQGKLTSAINEKKVWQYHLNYLAEAKHVYSSFFTLQNPRPDIVWNSKNPESMFMPFTTPKTQAIQDWLKTNVEDEWHVLDWHLQLNFVNKPNLAKIVFEPGTTPHVNDLGGDTITMDANTNLNDYDTTWTIRHEFGHVLGLPDCYVEFYDEKYQMMVSYQLDVTNLMCSRRGHLQVKHYDQLRKRYYKG